MSGKGLAIRHSGDVLLGGASGASCLLLNTKASQEAACSRAPAAIVPGRVPELRDAGVSRFVGNGSYLAEADAAEGQAGWVEGPGSSEFAKNGSLLAEVGAAEGRARQGKGQVAANSPKTAHTWQRRMPQRATRGLGAAAGAGRPVASRQRGRHTRPCARWQISI